MSDTAFTSKPPANGHRVEIVIGPLPRPYVIRTWLGGQLADEKAFAVKAEAEVYGRGQVRRFFHCPIGIGAD